MLKVTTYIQRCLISAVLPCMHVHKASFTPFIKGIRQQKCGGVISITTCTLCAPAFTQWSVSFSTSHHVTCEAHIRKRWSHYGFSEEALGVVGGVKAQQPGYRLLLHTTRGLLIASSVQLKEKSKHITPYSQRFTFLGRCATVIRPLQSFSVHMNADIYLCPRSYTPTAPAGWSGWSFQIWVRGEI